MEGWWRCGGMVEVWRDGGGVEGWWRCGGMVEVWRDGGGVEGWWRVWRDNGVGVDGAQ